jgi:serine/threonine-protein kinase
LPYPFIASLLNQMGRRDEAARAYERALARHEALVHKNGTDLYNLACAHACLASLISADPFGRTPARRLEAARHLDAAMAALRDTVDAGHRPYDVFASDPDLAPLRSRPDFRRMMMDLAFPDDPFAPSP